MTPEEEQAIRDSVKWAHLPGNLFPLNDAYRTRCDQLLEAMQDLAVANAKLADAERGRIHTQSWYARHYGKLEDWARKILPQPHRDQFFNCVANGSYDHALDVGKPYIAKAGFKVVPTNYFRVDTAEGQLILDQTSRAEAAESKIATLREALNRTLASATEGQRIAQERITKLCAEIATIQSNAADNYAAAENRAHEATQNHQEVFMKGSFVFSGISEECVNVDNIMRVTRYLDGVRLYMVDGSQVCLPNLPYESVKAVMVGGATQS